MKFALIVRLIYNLPLNTKQTVKALLKICNNQIEFFKVNKWSKGITNRNKT